MHLSILLHVIKNLGDILNCTFDKGLKFYCMQRLIFQWALESASLFKMLLGKQSTHSLQQATEKARPAHGRTSYSFYILISIN